MRKSKQLQITIKDTYNAKVSPIRRFIQFKLDVHLKTNHVFTSGNKVAISLTAVKILLEHGIKLKEKQSQLAILKTEYSTKAATPI